MNIVWTKKCFVDFRCFVWEGEGSESYQLMCSIRALDQTDQSSSLRFAFYTAETGQKACCLSRDCHCYNITYFIVIQDNVHTNTESVQCISIVYSICP